MPKVLRVALLECRRPALENRTSGRTNAFVRLPVMAVLALVTLSLLSPVRAPSKLPPGQRAAKVALVGLCTRQSEQIPGADAALEDLVRALHDAPRRRGPALPEPWACTCVCGAGKNVFSRGPRRSSYIVLRSARYRAVAAHKMSTRRWRDDRDLDAALADATFGRGWRTAPGASFVDAPDCLSDAGGDAEEIAARLRYLRRSAPPGSPADACTLRWRPLRVAPPPPPPGELLFRDGDFAVLRDAYSGRVAVASRTEVTKTPPLTLV